MEAPLSVADAAAIAASCLARGQVRLTVTGRCMEPALREGEVAVVERGPARWGDVVLLDHPEGLRLHRLVWAPLVGRWRTMGDAAPCWDPALPRERVLGVVRTSARDVGAALSSLLRGARARLAA